jgi:hypothetical protein
MEQTVEKTLEEKLQDTREEWTTIVKDLTVKMKDLPGIESLLNQVYIKRQECVEYLSNLLVTYGKLQRAHKVMYAQRYNFYKTNAQLRYSNDSAIATQIDAEPEMNDLNEKLDLIRVHVESMRETLKTIDNLIFGISQRTRIYEMMNGLKF